MYTRGIRNLLLIIGLGLFLTAAFLFPDKFRPPSDKLLQAESADLNQDIASRCGAPMVSVATDSPGLLRQGSSTPSNELASTPGQKENPAVADTADESDEEPLGKKKVYTMETLPQGKSGTYRVWGLDAHVAHAAADSRDLDLPDRSRECTTRAG